MATTRNQELQASINQAHVSIEHITSQMDSTHSRIDKLEHKFNNMEANLTTQFTSLQSVVNQLLNHPMDPSSSDQPDVVDSSQSPHFQSNSFHREPRLPT
jgi:flagellar capping protein FliD